MRFVTIVLTRECFDYSLSGNVDRSIVAEDTILVAEIRDPAIINRICR